MYKVGPLFGAKNLAAAAVFYSSSSQNKKMNAWGRSIKNTRILRRGESKQEAKEKRV